MFVFNTVILYHCTIMIISTWYNINCEGSATGHKSCRQLYESLQILKCSGSVKLL